MFYNDCSYYAIPYYGRISKYGQGFEHIYLLACVCPLTRQVKKTAVEIWRGVKAEDLGAWLAERQVRGVLANDSSLALEKVLYKYNIWTRWHIKGDALAMVEHVWKDLHPQVKQTECPHPRCIYL